MADAATAAKKKGLLVRLTVAPTVLAVVCGLLAWHHASGSSLPTDVVLALLAAGASYEVVAMAGRGETLGGVAVVALASAALAGLGAVFPDAPAARGAARSLVLAAGVLGVFALHFRPVRDGDLARLLAAVVAIVFVGYLFGLLRELGDGPDGAKQLVFVVVASKASDIGGWVVGKTLGRHKMIPSVSPGKTWEGTFGGLAFSVGAALLLFALLGPLPALVRTAPAAGVLGLVLGTASTLAGLCHSALKRRCAVKDSSALLPEMGGVLDMVDSIVLAAPAAWLWAWLA